MLIQIDPSGTYALQDLAVSAHILIFCHRTVKTFDMVVQPVDDIFLNLSYERSPSVPSCSSSISCSSSTTLRSFSCSFFAAQFPDREMDSCSFFSSLEMKIRIICKIIQRLDRCQLVVSDFTTINSLLILSISSLCCPLRSPSISCYQCLVKFCSHVLPPVFLLF